MENVYTKYYLKNSMNAFYPPRTVYTLGHLIPILFIRKMRTIEVVTKLPRNTQISRNGSEPPEAGVSELSIKDQRAMTPLSQAVQCLLQLLSSALIMQKQPQTREGRGVDVFQGNFSYKNICIGGGLSSPGLKSCLVSLPDILTKPFKIEM